MREQQKGVKKTIEHSSLCSPIQIFLLPDCFRSLFPVTLSRVRRLGLNQCKFEGLNAQRLSCLSTLGFICIVILISLWSPNGNLFSFFVHAFGDYYFLRPYSRHNQCHLPSQKIHLPTRADFNLLELNLSALEIAQALSYHPCLFFLPRESCCPVSSRFISPPRPAPRSTHAPLSYTGNNPSHYFSYPKLFMSFWRKRKKKTKQTRLSIGGLGNPSPFGPTMFPRQDK